MTLRTDRNFGHCATRKRPTDSTLTYASACAVTSNKVSRRPISRDVPPFIVGGDLSERVGECWVMELFIARDFSVA